MPAIAQDAADGRSADAGLDERGKFRRNAGTGRACYYSRSRKRFWRKGEESGHVQDVESRAGRLRRRYDPAQSPSTGWGSLPHRLPELLLSAGFDGEPQIVGVKVFDPAQVYHK